MYKIHFIPVLVVKPTPQARTQTLKAAIKYLSDTKGCTEQISNF